MKKERDSELAMMNSHREKPDYYGKPEDVLSAVNIYQKYSRYIELEQRRETYNESIERVIGMHIDKHPHLAKEIISAFEFVFSKKVLPSMRTLQFGGTAIIKNPARLYNCSYIGMTNYVGFSEIMFLLLSGVGVGFSVQKQHIKQMHNITKPTKEQRYRIPDSVEGWADAIKKLFKAYMGKSNIRPIFDYTDIRPAGSILKTSGGKAPGSDKLKHGLELIEQILIDRSNHDDNKLSSLEVHDIICIIADVVVSGGIRRSACISLFSVNDMQMITAKTGQWEINHPYRSNSNNSVVLERCKTTEKQFSDIFDHMQHSGYGEPGFFWVNDKNIGTNPCGEISLDSNSFCNLCEINLAVVRTQEELNETARAAAIIATIQASYTNFDYLSIEWEEVTKAASQIGVSLTGICDNPDYKSLNYKEAAQIVIETNIRIARELNINPSVRSTTVKPSGNASVVLRCSSGIHARHDHFYLRRLSLKKVDPIYVYLMQHNSSLVEQHHSSNDDAYIVVPMKSPDNAIVRNSETEIEFLERIKFFHEEWIMPGHVDGANTNNISATVSIHDNAWDSVKNWMWENRNSYNGISCINYDLGHYKQTPYESITEEDYNDRLEKFNELLALHHIDLTEIIEDKDYTMPLATAGCDGEKCELKTHV